MTFTPNPPKIVPPLDKTFMPMVCYRRDYRGMLADQAIKVMVGLKRGEEDFCTMEVRTLPLRHPEFGMTPAYFERVLKFLLWQRGAYEVYISGCDIVADHVRQVYSSKGARAFDAAFMENIYGKPFRVIECHERDMPKVQHSAKNIGRHLDGFRIGFDLGASDRKVSAIANGKTIFSEEVVWEPKLHSDSNYHYTEILKSIETAASHLPRVQAIGGSSAGIYIDNEPRVASLFRAVPPERYGEVRSIFRRIKDKFDVPLTVINDGDVTALAGSMSLGENAVLGLALGSSLAAGYVTPEGDMMGWINELAFAPIDLQPNAPREEWSGDVGCGASYLSQQAVFRLAPVAGIEIPEGLTDAGKLAFVQELLENGHSGARQIWETMGVYLGYAIAEYFVYYSIRNVLILGRCTSGRGGEILLQKAREVLRTEFPNRFELLKLHLPDEKIRRVGQAVAAASLPELSQK
ncbi:MAG TPA: ROK family protein [Bellilinea sp.]|nr:ROK family protein [Bellilinea sp.]